MKKIIILLSAVTIMSSCKKNDDTPASTLDLTIANIAGNYKITAATATPSGSTSEFDVYAGTTFYKDCQKDDILNFSTTSNYTYTDAGVTCSPNGTTTPSPFSVNATSKTLTYGGKTYDVVTFTNTQLVLKNVQDFNYSGTTISATLKFTLTRQ